VAKDKSITLHPKLGINARLTFCHRCGGESQELLLLGIANFKSTCPLCDTAHYGGAGNPGRGRQTCQRCDHSGFDFKFEELDEFEKLPSREPCDKCRELLRVAKENAPQGAILGKCKKCRSEFVLSGSSEWAKEVRKRLGIEPPALCGVELPQCTNCAEGPFSGTPSD